MPQHTVPSRQRERHSNCRLLSSPLTAGSSAIGTALALASSRPIRTFKAEVGLLEELYSDAVGCRTPDSAGPARGVAASR